MGAPTTESLNPQIFEGVVEYFFPITEGDALLEVDVPEGDVN